LLYELRKRGEHLQEKVLSQLDERSDDEGMGIPGLRPVKNMNSFILITDVDSMSVQMHASGARIMH